ncbi:unnamed protein product [Malus baccata var. baccata]
MDLYQSLLRSSMVALQLTTLDKVSESQVDQVLNDELSQIIEMVIKKWIEELKDQPWSREKKANDQPAFNWALDNKLINKVDLYLLPQAAFPTGGLYFKNKTWVRETKGMHVIIHNNYILGFEKKIKRFHDYDLWLVDDHADESPFGRI